jgi:nitroreductase
MIRRTPSQDLPGFVAAVEGRHSVRRFTADPVARADVREMVRLATLAANAGNAQPWRFVAVDDPALLAAMRAAVEERLHEVALWPEVQAETTGAVPNAPALLKSTTLFADAPLTIAVFGLPYESRVDRLLELHGVPREERDRLRARPDLQSVGAAVQVLLVAAHLLGYGACWMCAPVLAAHRLELLLGAEEPAHLVALVAVGVAAGPAPGGRPPAVAGRRPLDEVLRFLPAEPKDEGK